MNVRTSQRMTAAIGWRTSVIASAAAACFVVFGAVAVTERQVDYQGRGDSRYYLSMVARRWVHPERPGWSMQAVPSPLRYRILVPFIARQLPLDPVGALRTITYVSMAIAYAFLLLTCRRLGLSDAASIGGLAVAFVFLPNLDHYYNPLLTDGFGLMVVAAMTYAFVAESLPIFAVFGILGLFARETVLVLLPLWVFRNGARALALVAIAVVLVAVERALLPGPGQSLIEAFRVTGVWRLTHLMEFAKHVRATWAWAFACVPLGLILLPPASLRAVGPIAVIAMASAFASSMVATDVSRMFAILIPVVAIASAQLIASLLDQRRWLWLIVLGALCVVQFCVSLPNNFLGLRVWERMAVAVPTIRLGALWTVGAAIVLRGPLRQRISGYPR